MALNSLKLFLQFITKFNMLKYGLGFQHLRNIFFTTSLKLVCRSANPFQRYKFSVKKAKIPMKSISSLHGDFLICNGLKGVKLFHCSLVFVLIIIIITIIALVIYFYFWKKIKLIKQMEKLQKFLMSILSSVQTSLHNARWLSDILASSVSQLLVISLGQLGSIVQDSPGSIKSQPIESNRSLGPWSSDGTYVCVCVCARGGGKLLKIVIKLCYAPDRFS